MSHITMASPLAALMVAGITPPMSHLTKHEIVQELTAKTGFARKEVLATFELTLDAITRALAKGRNVELRNFGVFAVQRRQAKIGRNPMKPGVPVPIPARAVVKFKAGKTLRSLVGKVDLAGL